MALAAVAGLWSGSAWATLTIRPVPPHVLSNGTIFYPMRTTTSGASLLDGPSGFVDINPNVGILDGSIPDPGNGSGALILEVSSDTATAAAGKTLVLTATVSHDAVNGRDVSYVPIGKVEAGFCNAAGTPCLGTPPVAEAFNSTLGLSGFAVQYTEKTTLRIGIFPQDVCKALFQYQGQPAISGCAGSSGSVTGEVDVPSNNAKTMSITFTLITLDTATIPTSLPNTSPALPAAKDLSGEATTVTLNFQDLTAGSTSGCPTSTSDFYFPSDTAILLETTGLTSDTSNGAAPPLNLLVVGRDQNQDPSAPLTPTSPTTSPFSGNDLFERVRIGGAQRVGGFLNTEADDHPYQLRFMVINAAGVIANASDGADGSGTCKDDFLNVRATSISGFLKKSNCFIATAAYRSTDAGPVRMLREFRDQVLTRVPAGRAFVRWYYSWSPDAAEWLMENPAFRLPVLWVLAPLEVLAWLTLQPLIAAGLLAAGLTALVWSLSLRRRLGAAA